MTPTTCSIENCRRPSLSRGWCGLHYQRWYKHGDPLTPGRLPRPAAERLANKTIKQPDGCWQWTGSGNSDGYSQIQFGGRNVYVHRLAYELANGPIPAGMQIDHRCFNRRCVNPEHLRPTTAKQNNENRRGAQRNSRSGVRGVYWDSGRKKWQAELMHHGRNIHLGRFDSVAAAAEAVAAKRREIFTHSDMDWTDAAGQLELFEVAS